MGHRFVLPFAGVAGSLVMWLALASVAAAQPAQGSGVADGQPTDYSARVAELGSAEFRLRQRAFDFLVSAGPDAVPAVVEALLSDDAETRARATAILERLAESRDRSGTRVARELLEERAELEHEGEPNRAQAALVRLREAWSAQAMQQIQQLGGSVQKGTRITPGAPPGYQVHLSRNWKGGNERLDLLLDLDPVLWLTVENSQITDDGLLSIAQLTDLRRLYLGNSQITGMNLSRLQSLQKLDYLSLKQLPIDDEDLARLPALPELKSLGLDSTRITDAGLEHLKRYPQLQVLWLDHTKVTDEGVKQLTNLDGLRILYLQGMATPGPGLAALEKLPNLTYLSLKGATLQPDTLKHLAKLGQLETLGLDHTNVTDAQLADLVKMPKLKTLWLSKTEISDGAIEHLVGLPHLQTLYLHGSKVTAEGANMLREARQNIQVFR
jgi:Leucine-rich repeat (LRR) protein